MEYTITIDKFEGPMDLLLHLIKKSDIDIFDIQIEVIIDQYLDYLNQMEQLDLDIASEYLVLAAELIEIKSSMLLPKPVIDSDEYMEDPKEALIKRLLEYERYKKITDSFKDLESERKMYFTKEVSDLREFATSDTSISIGDITIDDLTKAFENFLERKELEKPLNTKITKKEYSVADRTLEIKSLLKKKKKIEFEELFEVYTKDYVVVTFLSILDMARKHELKITQDNNFSKIILEGND